MKRILSLFVLAVLAATGFAGWHVYEFLTTPPETPGREAFIRVDPGMNGEQVAQVLYKEGVIRDPLGFKLLARFSKMESKVKAGEYQLSTGLTPGKVLELLVNGQAILHKVVVPEGLTMRQIAKLVEQAGLGDAAAFERAAKDKELLAKYAIPADSGEGFLYPDTYAFTKKPGNDPRQVAEAMFKQFVRHLSQAWPPGAAGETGQGPPQGKALLDAVILASIVEKETGKAEERPKIAGVFVNRLNRKMLLQTDPTIIYGLGDRFDGNLKRSHLDDPKNRYNTYQHPGLPPGPICNPGLEALKAVARPEEHDLLYFVAKGDGSGSHSFSATLEEHNRAVAKYQLHKGK